MQTKQLGKSSLKFSPVTFGGNVFGWTVDEKRSFELLDALVAAGFNTIDTADVYSSWKPGNIGGESETIIGKWLKERKNRSSVIIATKVGSDMGQGKVDLSKNYIRKAVNDSLNRLQTDYIDLYQTHQDDAGTPVEETLEIYSELIKEGKVRFIGASNLTPERFKASLEASEKNGYPRYESLQPCYNLYDREGYEKELEKICLDEQIGVISYYSLASGFLTGKYRLEEDFSKSQRGAGTKKYLDARGFKILKALDETAAEYNTTQAAIAIAWLLARPSVTSPIASATNISQLNSLIQAAELKLSAETIARLTEASSY
jgi:aryl-alcohol dehydrogenase-like predicted oxidoreductase